MSKLLSLGLALLAFGLPLHGGITVFLPEVFRWWKEGVLLLLAFLTTFYLWSDRTRFWAKLQKTSWRDALVTPAVWALAFLVWGTLLAVTSDLAGLMAWRYLGLGFGVFVLAQFWPRSVWRYFVPSLTVGVFFSVSFGLWTQFFAGFELLETWYSQTLSSWVPGQTLPLYHLAGETIRLQGLSSGPVELAHLAFLVLGLNWLNWRKTKCQSQNYQLVRLVAIIVIALGMYLTQTRAVMLASSLVLGSVLVWQAWEYLFKETPSSSPLSGGGDYKWMVAFGSLLITLLVLVGAKFWLTHPSSQDVAWLKESVELRGGSLDHLIKPVEAFQAGLKTPFLGQLGIWGPAGRWENLKTNNNDFAPVAENVLADWWVQLGAVGLSLGLGFLVSVFWKLQHHGKNGELILFIGLLSLMNLASIFDMTPISVLFFLGLVWMIECEDD